MASCLELVYGNFLLLGDFNMSAENPNLKYFVSSFGLDRLKESSPCYKSINPCCIDLILTNKKNHFIKSTSFGIDQHKLTTTVQKKVISKSNSIKIFFGDYKIFD